MKIIHSIFKTLLLSALIVAQVHFAHAQTASLLPNAVQQFFDNNGNPLSSGTVQHFIPSTTTPKTVWRDSNKVTPWTNTITLNAAGRPPGNLGIFGDGSYDQQVKDRNGNLIWDQPTSTGSGGSSGSTVGDGNSVGTIKIAAGLVAPNNYQFAYGQAISRTTFSALLAAVTSTQSITCTGASPTITNISDTSQFGVGTVLEAICVSGSPTVISKTVNSVTLSANASISTSTTGIFYPYGNGDGLTTFNVPDLRGYVIAGRCNMGGVDCSNLNSTYFSSNINNTPSGLAKGGNQNSTLTLAQLPTGITSANTGLVPSTGATTQKVVNGPNTGSAAAGGTQVTAADSGSGGQNSVVGVNSNIAIGSAAVTSNNTSGSPHSIVQSTQTMNFVIKVLPDVNLSIAFCASLQDAGTACTANTGTSGHNLPFLDGINTWSSVQTFSVAPIFSSLTGYLKGNGVSALTASATVPATDLSGTIAAARLPALTGDVTSSVGTVATTISANAVTNAKLNTMPANTIKANATSGVAVPTDVSIPALTQKVSPVANDKLMIADSAASDQLKYATVSSIASAGSVSSIAGNTGAFTLGVGLTNAVNDLQVSLSKFTNSIGADVALNNTANYFDGPSVAQGTSGTWFASGTVTLTDTGGAASMFCKLWDGTTVIASGAAQSPSGSFIAISLSGVLASPAANIKISCRDPTAITGKILFNQSGNSKDGTVTAMRINP